MIITFLWQQKCTCAPFEWVHTIPLNGCMRMGNVSYFTASLLWDTEGLSNVLLLRPMIKSHINLFASVDFADFHPSRVIARSKSRSVLKSQSVMPNHSSEKLCYSYSMRWGAGEPCSPGNYQTVVSLLLVLNQCQADGQEMVSCHLS